MPKERSNLSVSKEAVALALDFFSSKKIYIFHNVLQALASCFVCGLYMQNDQPIQVTASEYYGKYSRELEQSGIEFQHPL